jgi:tetratricopeptide (TPR) repeat protein
MIKFFRRIRQNLLTENKFNKYLIYAIGEIILVVIGILIALQINNWNENKKSIAQERIILSSLLEDFETNSRNLQVSLKLYNNAGLSLDRKLNYVGRNADAFDQEIKDDLILMVFWSPGLVNGTLNSLLYSDQLGLIQNNDLKKMLTAYPFDIDANLALIEEYRVMLVEKHRPLLDSYVSLLDLSSIKEEYPEVSSNAIRSDYKGLLNDSRFQNLVIREIQLIKRYVNVTTGFLNRTNYIIDLIRAALALPVKLERLVNSDKPIDEVIEIVKQQDMDAPVYDISENSIIDLGYKLMEEDQNNKALKLFKLSTELYPDAWNAHDSYGECLLKMGDKENAIKAYRKSLELKPDNEYAIKALSELE